MYAFVVEPTITSRKCTVAEQDCAFRFGGEDMFCFLGVSRGFLGAEYIESLSFRRIHKWAVPQFDIITKSEMGKV